MSEVENTEKEIKIQSISNTLIKTSLTVNDNDLTVSTSLDYKINCIH